MSCHYTLFGNYVPRPYTLWDDVTIMAHGGTMLPYRPTHCGTKLPSLNAVGLCVCGGGGGAAMVSSLHTFEQYTAVGTNRLWGDFAVTAHCGLMLPALHTVWDNVATHCRTISRPLHGAVGQCSPPIQHYKGELC